MKTPTNIKAYFDTLASYAIEALHAEAYLSPKPGLVDAINSGAHRDMDINLFIKSGEAFKGGFVNYLIAGFEHAGTPQELLAAIRFIGIEAEKDMFQATQGVNTHKGANFSFGIVLSSIGHFVASSSAFTSLPYTNNQIITIFSYIKEMAQDLIKNDFKNIEQKANLTYGENLYKMYGFAGIRAEVEAGFPSILNAALPVLFSMPTTSYSYNERYTQTLFTLMATVDDSNIINRGGFEALTYTKQAAKEFLEAGGVKQKAYQQVITTLDTDFIAKNLSPGGSADLLALTIFIDMLLSR